MAMGRRRKGRQWELFVAASEIRALGNLGWSYFVGQFGGDFKVDSGGL